MKKIKEGTTDTEECREEYICSNCTRWSCSALVVKNWLQNHYTVLNSQALAWHVCVLFCSSAQRWLNLLPHLPKMSLSFLLWYGQLSYPLSLFSNPLTLLKITNNKSKNNIRYKITVSLFWWISGKAVSSTYSYLLHGLNLLALSLHVSLSWCFFAFYLASLFIKPLFIRCHGHGYPFPPQGLIQF